MPIQKKPTSSRKKKKQPIGYLNYFFMVSLILLGVLGYTVLSIDSKPHTKEIDYEPKSPIAYENQGRLINKVPSEAITKEVPTPKKSKEQPSTKEVTKIKPSPKITPRHQCVEGCKLVIIIDDIARQSQLNELQQIPLQITASIFPPSELSQTSHYLATNSHHMIHLPLESDSKQMNKMRGTLFANATKEEIYARTKELRLLFPKARYVNNHTGSVFTSNARSMSILYDAFMKYGFVMVDSRTTKNTVVPQLAQQYGHRYFARDVFLDNVRSKEAIRKQLKLAINIAKKNKIAIAIGHPYPETFEVLRGASSMLDGVEVVYVDRLGGL